jgi:hypothetical protein
MAGALTARHAISYSVSIPFSTVQEMHCRRLTYIQSIVLMNQQYRRRSSTTALTNYLQHIILEVL